MPGAIRLNTYFNDRNLADIPFVQITKRNHFKRPTMSFDTANLADGSGSRLIHRAQGVKDITIDLDIRAPSRAEMETSRDLLISILEPLEGRLEFEVAGVLRRWYATAKDPVMPDDVRGGYLPVSVVFMSNDGYGYDTADTTPSVFSGNQTTSPNTKPVTFTGNVRQVPVITLVYTAIATGGGYQTLSLNNPATGETVSINRIWTGTETVVFDCASEKVTVNGVEVEPYGNFPRFTSNGASNITVTDTFNSRTYTGAVKYRRRYR